MTIPELIDEVLASIRGQFYGDRPREFGRDRNALLKAIARWGHECSRRGWHFDAGFIARDLCELLNEIKRSGCTWGYLPVYLEGAVDRRIGERAEQLSATAKALPNITAKLVAGVRGVEAVRELSDTEILGKVYSDTARRQRARRAMTKRVTGKMNQALRRGPKQGELL